MIKYGTGGRRAAIGEDFIRENVRHMAAGVVKLAQAQNMIDRQLPIMPLIL